MYWVVADWQSQTQDFRHIRAIAMGPYTHKIDAEEGRVVYFMPYDVPSIIAEGEEKPEWFTIPPPAKVKFIP